MKSVRWYREDEECRVPIWKINFCSRVLRLSMLPWCREKPQTAICCLEWLGRLKCPAFTPFFHMLELFSHTFHRPFTFTCLLLAVISNNNMLLIWNNWLYIRYCCCFFFHFKWLIDILILLFEIDRTVFLFWFNLSQVCKSCNQPNPSASKRCKVEGCGAKFPEKSVDWEKIHSMGQTNPTRQRELLEKRVSAIIVIKIYLSF